MRKTTSGFTIVELLIVIVVIAILAAISIVAYNGIQQRARNSQTLSGVQAYQKILMSYAAVNGSFPALNGCLGANYPSDQCWVGPNGNFSVNNTLDTALASFVSVKPVVSTKVLTITGVGDFRLGALYRYVSSTDVRIIYYLEGQAQKCLDGTTGATWTESTQCTITLVP